METLIYDYLLAKCIGYDNRVKAQTIMNMFNIKDNKAFRGYIQNIRNSYKYDRLIGSEAGKKGGYWIINSKDEFIYTVHHLLARAEEMENTAAAMEEKYEKLERGF